MLKETERQKAEASFFVSINFIYLLLKCVKSLSILFMVYNCAVCNTIFGKMLYNKSQASFQMLYNLFVKHIILLFNKNNKQLSTSRKTDLLEFADPANQCDQFVFKYKADIRDRRVTRCFHMKMFKFLKD